MVLILSTPKSTMQAPFIKKALIEWLEYQFPNRIPDKPLTKQEYDVMVGEQRVVSRLRRELERQSQDPINHY